MEILTAVLCFLQIANISFTMLERFKPNDKDKEILSSVLLHIGRLLDSVSDDLNKGIYPHGKCKEMEHYAQKLKELLQGKMTTTEIQELSQLLNDSMQVEKLLAELNNLSVPDKKENINLLKSASGSFLAWGSMCKL